MGFLKKNKVPGELPDLAIQGNRPVDNSKSHLSKLPDLPKPGAPTPHALQRPSEPAVQPVETAVQPVETAVQPVEVAPQPVVAAPKLIEAPKEIPKKIVPEHPVIPEPPKQVASPAEVRVEETPVQVKKTEIAGEDYLEFSNIPKESTEREEIRKQIKETLHAEPEENSFFDKILEDINGEIEDLGKLEEWYQNKFLPQDVVSNMRNYWEDNKADMIIRSFGGEYKEKINEKIKRLQGLEGDWREIYFKLVKKEEEMKKEERGLKETLSEFVELCKRRKLNGEKKEE